MTRRKLSRAFHEIMDRALQLRLEEYPSTLKEDKALLKATQHRRQRIAIQLRLGEMALIQEAREYCQKMIGDPDEESSAKKTEYDEAGSTDSGQVKDDDHDEARPLKKRRKR